MTIVRILNIVSLWRVVGENAVGLFVRGRLLPTWGRSWTGGGGGGDDRLWLFQSQMDLGEGGKKREKALCFLLLNFLDLRVGAVVVLGCHSLLSVVL